MPTIRYKDRHGNTVPGVTTILNAWGGNKGALMYWSWDCGMKGLNYREVSKTACDIGTVAHAMVEADMHGQVYDTAGMAPEIVDKAETAFLAFLEWKRLVDYQVVATEINQVAVS